MTSEQQACEHHFISTKTQRFDGSFVVRLPIKMDPKQLGSSRLSAEGRLHAIESRLERQPDLKTHNHEFLKEYEEEGHMEPVYFQEHKHAIFCHTMQFSRKPVPLQKLELPMVYH